MESHILIPVFILLALITEPILPLYGIFLIIYTQTPAIYIQFIAAAQIIISLCHSLHQIQQLVVIAFSYTLLLTASKKHANANALIRLCKTPYLILNQALLILSHNAESTSLPFYSKTGSIKQKLSLITLDNGESLPSFLSKLFHCNDSQVGKFTCCFSTIINGIMQYNKYEVHYTMLKPGQLYLAFLNLTSDYILKQNTEYDKLKLRITSSISHELRNPLNGIIGIFSQLKTLIDSKLRNLILTGISSSHLLRYKIDSFIDLVQIMQKELNLNLHEITVDDLLSNINKIFTPLIQNGIYFSIKKDSLLPKSIIQDEDRLMQIIVKLIFNALKYTSKGLVTLELTIRYNL
jgi:nitrogen-specific signal transduction histidine kinase